MRRTTTWSLSVAVAVVLAGCSSAVTRHTAAPSPRPATSATPSRAAVRSPGPTLVDGLTPKQIEEIESGSGSKLVTEDGVVKKPVCNQALQFCATFVYLPFSDFTNVSISHGVWPDGKKAWYRSSTTYGSSLSEMNDNPTPRFCTSPFDLRCTPNSYYVVVQDLRSEHSLDSLIDTCPGTVDDITAIGTKMPVTYLGRPAIKEMCQSTSSQGLGIYTAYWFKIGLRVYMVGNSHPEFVDDSPDYTKTHIVEHKDSFEAKFFASFRVTY